MKARFKQSGFFIFIVTFLLAPRVPPDNLRDRRGASKKVTKPAGRQSGSTLRDKGFIA